MSLVNTALKENTITENKNIIIRKWEFDMSDLNDVTPDELDQIIQQIEDTSDDDLEYMADEDMDDEEVDDVELEDVDDDEMDDLEETVLSDYI
jgi:hypothetical protein